METIQTKEKENLTSKKQEKEKKISAMKKIIANLSAESKFKFWIKTLLGSYNIFPEIIKTVDKIIELQASTISFVGDIYNDDKTTLGEMEKVIDLTERKNALLNIYIMTKDMLAGISPDDFEILEKKYCLAWSIEELSKEYGISIRTTYRKIDRAIDEIYHVCTKRNWSLRLIESQVKDENWLFDRFYKNVKEYYRNSNYFAKCEQESENGIQSKSSSES